MSGDSAERVAQHAPAQHLAAQHLAEGVFGGDLKQLAKDTEASLAHWNSQDRALYGADLQDDIATALARAAQDEALATPHPSFAQAFIDHCQAVAAFQGAPPPATLPDALAAYNTQQAALAAAIRRRHSDPEKDATLQALLAETLKLRSL